MRLLIIGKPDSHVSLASQMASSKAHVTQAPDAESALHLLRNGKGADLVMIDVVLDIASFIQALSLERIVVPVVGYGIHASSEDAVKAIKAGAKEYIPLPPDKELIAAVLQAIAEENNTVLGKSAAMERILTVARQVAPAEASVLITGESGTGKEVIARFIHQNSRRAKEAFITVNCAAIPENLLESEMFGHERGAFTGATARRLGKFEEANNGTLLLDEISEMDIRLQAKLLRALQEKEIDRVGGSRPVKVNIRVIATSNRDLRLEVKEGRFREDLFFRLNIIHLELPPLRQRKEDIQLFADYFAEKYAKLNHVPNRPFSEGAMHLMMNYAWPGNVRELENTMHRAVLLATGNQIEEPAVMLQSGDAKESNAVSSGDLVGRTVESVERELILNTLDHCLGNRTHAANILGISIRTLRNKLKEYGQGEAA